MRKIFSILIILPIISCVSTKNVAETRNAEVASSNHYEMYKLWRELDIARFTNNISRVKIVLIPEKNPSAEPDSTNQIYKIYSYFKNEIARRDSGFASLKTDYFNSPDSEKTKLYTDLKSDTKDKEFLSKLENNSYIELYENMETKSRKALVESRFYSSQKEFEDYLRNRSFSMAAQIEIGDIPDHIAEKHRQNFLSRGINFLIPISASYNLDYSDRAQDHIGSDKINFKLINVKSGHEIITAQILNYWGNE